MNPLLLPEYLMDKIRKLSGRVSVLREGELWNIIMLVGLTVTISIFLSGAPYIATYFEEVKRYDISLLYGYGVFFLPRSAGDTLTQTSYEMIYVLVSYLLAGIGIFILVRGSKSISHGNMLVLAGVFLIAISVLLILGLDYLKIYTRLS